MASLSILQAPEISTMATSLDSHRKILFDGNDIRDSLPSLNSPDYFLKPSMNELFQREIESPGFCSRVPDFTVGRIGYGLIKFIGTTDVRKLDLDQIVQFQRHEVVVYDDESSKPAVGEGLNKPAEVTLIVNMACGEERADHVSYKLKQIAERQGATFISFDPEMGFWNFLVPHFSRFGLSDDEAEDITMDDAPRLENHLGLNGDMVVADVDIMETSESELSHSLPAHLGLDPGKMKEMRLLMFPREDLDESEEFGEQTSFPMTSLTKRNARPSQKQRNTHQDTPPVVRKTPLALLEYNPGNDKSSPGSILMVQQNKNLAVRKSKMGGFELDISHETPLTDNYSRNVVDAALFMGRSFRAGWGPNGVLLHTGNPIGSSSSQIVLSSVISVDKIAIDKVVRDKKEKVQKELIDSAFETPLSLHKELYHEEEKEIRFGSFSLKLQKVVTDRVVLSDICRNYIDIIEKQLEFPGLSTSAKLFLTHQVMVWELIKVLFSERQSTYAASDNEEDMMQDVKEESAEVDTEALPLIRRAEFSCWLQECVSHRVQEDVSDLNGSGYLKHLFFLLTGRELDSAVELAISKGDVRLACLLSQVGGSTVNRDDIMQQLHLWGRNGLDFNYIEKDRIKLYELLAGNIHDALQDFEIDWKRFLGLLMWHHLAPDSSLPVIFRNYQLLLDQGKAPWPVPIYIDEGPADGIVSNTKHSDLLYYLMLLHSREEQKIGFLKTMFSAFSSTDDPLDYHMIWHQRGILEAVGAFTSDDLHGLDMGFVAQLLSQGLCHWAIYVVLHMPYRKDRPYLHFTVIREILFQFCETWSSVESQRQFIKDLGIPSEWMHEALAVYYNYHGDFVKALDHFIECANWERAHSIFMTSVAHSLFLSANHSEIWRIATSMDHRKSEIENWDLGAGIYMSFYLLKSSLEEDADTMLELDSPESRNESCRSFVGRLNESLAVWGDRLPVEARVAYTKMAEEICELLLSGLSVYPDRDSQLRCFMTAFKAPLPEDVRSSHLQDAVSLFSLYLSETGHQTSA
ncbi:PREDICTED: nuclear pore complex protein NUP96 [Brassica oleracea var. oleracea]|uniref:Peptidase S59 domain-containing protein n=1 Tax=Brassica oleracea var. oleracea TaxID=109376 RepID=A0A0D3ARU7_BRAOL|nr:PREDICTED: nuclear pore complex protein NUP96 [Brassica oleracea var. oleracea]